MSKEIENSPKEASPAKESATKGAAARSIRKGASRSKKKKDEAVLELTEEEKAEKEAEKRRKYIYERCTLLRFIMLDKSEREVLCEGQRCELYTDLQRLIAQKTPRCLKIFIIQDHETGVIMTSENFKHTHTYRVKEMANRKLEATVPFLIQTARAVALKRYAHLSSIKKVRSSHGQLTAYLVGVILLFSSPIHSICVQ